MNQVGHRLLPSHRLRCSIVGGSERVKRSLEVAGARVIGEELLAARSGDAGVSPLGLESAALQPHAEVLVGFVSPLAVFRQNSAGPLEKRCVGIHYRPTTKASPSPKNERRHSLRTRALDLVWHTMAVSLSALASFSRTPIAPLRWMAVQASAA